MPVLELMATIASTDPEGQVRGRVVRFLRARGYQTTADPAELKRGSLFGSLTGFSPKKWAVTVRFKLAEPGVYFYRFAIDTTGQTVTRAEREFWEMEKQGLEDTIQGKNVAIDASDRAVASQNKGILTTIFLYSIAGGFLVGAAMIALHFVGVEVFPGFAGIGAGLGAAVGFQRAVETA